MPEDKTERTPERKESGGLDSAFSRKYGPVPGWAIVVGVAGAAALVWWLRRRSAKGGAGDTPTTDTTATPTGDELAGDAGTFAVLQSEIMQLQGEAATHTGTTPTGGTTTPTGGTTTPTGGTTTPKPKPKPPAPKTKYVTVTVQQYTDSKGPWQSTLSGIAGHYNVPGGYKALAELNGIENPNLIHPGQKIKVPVPA